MPRELRAPRFGLSADAAQGEYETQQASLTAANAWLSQQQGRVVNVETVVLPNLRANWEQGSTDPVLGAPSGAPLWYQFIRVWYEQ